MRLRYGDRSRRTMGGLADGVCRLCGSSGAEPLRPLLGDLAVLVSKYIGISIRSDDAFPTECCIECVNKLQTFHEYVQQCVNFQNRLLELSTLNNAQHGNNIKIELDFQDLDHFKKESFDTDDAEQFDIKEEFLSNESIDLDDGDSCNYDSNSDTPLTKFKTKKKLKTKKSRLSSKENGSLKNSSKFPNLQKYIKFNCHICNETSANWFRLKNHILQKHQDTPRVYCECGYVLKSKTAIYRHVAGHNDPASFACDKCSRITKTKSALEKHMRRHLPKESRIFHCMNCPKTCNSKESLKSHERVHFPLPERYKYPCGICKNKFTTKSAVLGHIRAVHEKLKRFVCDICGYACSTSGELVQHRAIHSDEKLFQCKICSKRFKTSSNLNSHTDTHSTTSYPCGVCGKVLNSRRTLRKHFLVHEDLCKHICTYCNKAFKRRQTLKVHLTIHTGDKPIQCRWCPLKFAYSSVYRSHKHKVHFDKISSNESAVNNPTGDNTVPTEDPNKIDKIESEPFGKSPEEQAMH